MANQPNPYTDPNASTALMPRPQAPQGSTVPAPIRQDVVRVPFMPVKPPEEEIYRVDSKRKIVRRIVVYGLLSLFLGLLVFVFIEKRPAFLLDIPYIGPAIEGVSLSWSGLLVYSSIVALVLFLCILLFRYFALLNLAYVNTAKHAGDTAEGSNFTPPISIIVPAYNEGVLLRETVMSLLQQDYPQFEIVIVDDGSKDDTRAIANELIGQYSHITVKLVEKENGGKSTALNAGIQVCTSDFVLCVDGDSQLSPNTLRSCIHHFLDERVGAVAGNVKVMNRNNLWTTLQALEYVEGLNMARAAQSSLKLVNIIPGPLGMFRKQAIVEAGWYDSDTYAEDCDITLQLISDGWKVEYEPDAISFTEAPNTLPTLLKQRYRWTRGILQAIRKHKGLFRVKDGNLGGAVVMYLMAFESLVWPVMNIFANLYFVIIAGVFGLSSYLVFWWLSLTILDLVAAFYCVAVEKEEVRLIFYSIFYRLFFILIIDVCKTFATVEEFLGIGMTWGKLQRLGKAA
ncbi:MAG: glycosyltransferase [Bacteroidota bacterium]